MFRKIRIFIFCVLIIATLGSGAYAASSPVVYADKVTVSADEDLKIPVFIKDNSGLMGFHFILKYNPDKITVTNVASSDLTSGGVFSQNLNLKDGKFDVVWSNAENMSEDGPLFYLFLRANELEEDASVKISYVKDDTFNEAFENVAVNCKDISISKVDDSDEKPDNASAEVVENNPEEDFIAKEISDEVITQLNEKDAISIANEVMKEEGIDGISKIKPEQARTILNKIKTKMEEQGMSTDSIDKLMQSAEDNENLDSDRVAYEAVRSIYKTSVKVAKAEDQNIKVDSAGSRFPVRAVVIALILAAIIAGILGFILYRRNHLGGAEK